MSQLFNPSYERENVATCSIFMYSLCDLMYIPVSVQLVILRYILTVANRKTSDTQILWQKELGYIVLLVDTQMAFVYHLILKQE